MKHLRLILIIVAVWMVAQPLIAADTDAVLNSWFAAQKNLQSWSADFVQTRTLKALTQPLTAAGHVDFAMPDQFRWQLGHPARTIALGGNGEMYVIYPLLKRAEHYPLGQNTPKQWRDMMSLLQAGLPHDRSEFTAEFQILSLTQTNHAWLFALQPRSAFARQMMPELQLGVATNNYSLVSTELIFVDGSRLRSDFTNAVLNPVLDKTVFAWQPPADFKVTDPLSQ